MDSAKKRICNKLLQAFHEYTTQEIPWKPQKTNVKQSPTCIISMLFNWAFFSIASLIRCSSSVSLPCASSTIDSALRALPTVNDKRLEHAPQPTFHFSSSCLWDQCTKASRPMRKFAGVSYAFAVSNNANTNRKQLIAWNLVNNMRTRAVDPVAHDTTFSYDCD